MATTNPRARRINYLLIGVVLVAIGAALIMNMKQDEQWLGVVAGIVVLVAGLTYLRLSGFAGRRRARQRPPVR